MEIDHNAVRGTGTGDPNFKIDITSLAGKPGGLPAMTSLSSSYAPDPSNMSPIQKAGHIVGGVHPGAHNNSVIISQGGPNGPGPYVGSSKIGSAASNYQTLQLAQESELGQMGVFSPQGPTVKAQKQMFQLPQASKTAVQHLQQQQFSMGLDSGAPNQRKISATRPDAQITGSAQQPGANQPDYQTGPGAVSQFNQ